MQFTFYKPRNELLKKYIESYYFVVPNNSKNEVKYLTFPNNYTIVTIAKDVEEKFTENSITVLSSKEENLKISLIKKYQKPIQVEYLDEILEITIYFKPLGFNQFSESFENIHSEKLLTSSFHEEALYTINSIFVERDLNKKIELFENYLLSQFKEVNFPMIETILEKLNLNMGINDIAASMDISRQYLNKIFTATVGKSPSEYKKINRFRKSIRAKNSLENFTEVSSEHDFFDQSHFIKDFKNITLQKPTQFFRNVDFTKENFWLYI